MLAVVPHWFKHRSEHVMILYWHVRFFTHNLMLCESTPCYVRYTRWILFKVNTRSPGQSTEMSNGQGGMMITWSLLLNALSSYIAYLLWEGETQINEMADFLFKNGIKYLHNANFKCVLGISKCNASRKPTHGIQHCILLSHSNTLYRNTIPTSGLLL